MSERWTEETLAHGKGWALVRMFGELRIFVGMVRGGQPMDGASTPLSDVDVATLRDTLAGVAVPEPCPTCSPPYRETVGMVCQTCGTDYTPEEGQA